ncbi:MAG: ankyrin repeat domain-containing protein [Candidatus Berkiellales bacterium]
MVQRISNFFRNITGLLFNNEGHSIATKAIQPHEVTLTQADGFSGLPILKSQMTDQDLVLFSYDENFAHVIPQGKTFMHRLHQYSQKQGIAKIFLPIEGSQLENVRTACQAANIAIPELAVVRQGVESPNKVEDKALTLPSPSWVKINHTINALTQNDVAVAKSLARDPRINTNVEACQELLRIAYEFEFQEVFEYLLHHPVLNEGTDHPIDRLHYPLTKGAFIKNSLKRKPCPPKLFPYLYDGVNRVADSGTLEELESLLSIPGLVENVSNLGKPAIRNAVDQGEVEILTALLKIPSINNVDNIVGVVVHSAEHVDWWKEFLENSVLFARIIHVARHGTLEELQSALKTPGLIENVEHWGKEAIRKVVERGDVRSLMELLKIPDFTEDVLWWWKDTIWNTVWTGNVGILLELLKTPNINEDEYHWQSWLETAAEKDHVEVFKELWRCFEKKNTLEIHFYSRLLYFARKSPRVLQFLLSLPQLTTPNSVLFEPVVDSMAREGHVEIFQKLRQLPAWQTNANKRKCQQLLVAVKSGNGEQVNELLPEAQTFLPENMEYCQAIVDGAFSSRGNIAIIQRLCTVPILNDLLMQNNFGLNEAVRNGRLDMVRFFLSFPSVVANVTVPEDSFLVEEMNKRRIYSPFDPGLARGDNRFLETAARKGFVPIVHELLNYAAARGEGSWLKWIAAKLCQHFSHRFLPLVMQNWVMAWYKPALMGAIKNNHLEVVRIFLSNPLVRSQAALWGFDALHEATQRSHYSSDLEKVEVLQELLNVPEIEAQAASDDNSALLNAANDYAALDQLFMIEAVRLNAGAARNRVLAYAARRGALDCVRRLLTSPSVVDAIDVDNNAIFKDTVGRGHFYVVQELLKYRKVVDKIAVNNNFALHKAIELNHPRIVTVLLKYPAVRKKLTFKIAFDILFTMPQIGEKIIQETFEEIFAKLQAEQSLTKKELLDIANRIKPKDRVAQQWLLKYLQCFGYNPIDNNLPLIDSLKASITQSFSQPFANPRAHAGNILQLSAEAKNVKINLADLADHHESADDDILVKQANERFDEKIKPLFKARFTSIEEIETKLHAVLIERKLSELKAEDPRRNREAITFIEQNKEKLIARNSEVMEQSLRYFNSNSDTLDMCLRTLNAGAPSQEWDKLFVAPKKEQEQKEVFSTRAAYVGSINLLQTTQITRERLCYAYLVATDPALLPKQQKKVMKAIIYYLAEIGRAHNMSTTEVDNPSCFPGTISRLDNVFQAHPMFKVDPVLSVKIREIASQLVVKVFGDALRKLPTAEDKLALYEALSLYSDFNALNIINKPESILDTQGESAKLTQLLKIRQNFFNHYFGENAEKGIAEINDKLIKEFSLFLDEDTQVIALAALMNMGRASLTTTFSLTECYQRAVPPPQRKERTLEGKNPYCQTYGDIFAKLQFLNNPARQEKKAKEQYTCIALKRAEYDCIYQGLVATRPDDDANKLMQEAKEIVEGRFNHVESTTLNEMLLELDSLEPPKGITITHPTAQAIEDEMVDFHTTMATAKPPILPKFSAQKAALAVAPKPLEEEAMDLEEDTTSHQKKNWGVNLNTKVI